MGLYLRDLIRDIHTFHNFSEYSIAKVALAVIEESVVCNVDKELAGRAVFIRSARHSNRAAGITQSVISFILDGRVRFLLLHLLGKTATLHHEARDHTVERSVVIETAVDIIDKVLH